MKRYACDVCGNTVGNKKIQATHCQVRVRNAIPEGQSLPLAVPPTGQKTQDVVGQNFDPAGSKDSGQNLSLTPDSSNEDVGLTRVKDAGSKGQSRPPLPSSSEGEEGSRFFDPSPPQSARAREGEAIAYLSARTEYLKPWERSFFLGVRSRDRALTDKQRATLFEIEAIVQGYEAKNERWREENQRAQHPLKKLEPGHDKAGCRYCLAEADSAARAKVLFEKDMAELAVLGEEIKARREREALQASRTSPGRDARGRLLPHLRSSQPTPKASTEAPKNG